MSQKNKKQYNFLKEENDISNVEVKVDKVSKFEAPEKQETKYFNFPFKLKSGGFPVEKVEFFRLDFVKDGKRRFFTIKKPDNEELVHRLVELCGEPKVRHTTVVLELTAKLVGKTGNKSLRVSDVKPAVLVLDNDKISQLRNISQSNDISKLDISVTSNNPQYQAMSFQYAEGRDGEASYLSCPLFETEDEVEELIDQCAELYEEGWRAVCKEYEDKTLKGILKNAENSEEEEEDDLDEDEEEEDEKPRKKVGKKFVRRDEDDLDEDDEPTPRKKKLAAKDEDDDEEDEEEALNKRMSQRTRKVEDDDEDEDEADNYEESADEDEEEDSDSSYQEDDDEEDEDEPAPARRAPRR